PKSRGASQEDGVHMEVKPGYKQTEIGVIPEDWEAIRLRDCIDLKNGYAFESAFFSDRGHLLLTPGNFSRTGRLIFDSTNTKRFCGVYPHNSLLSKGDLLLVMTDLTPDCKLLGKPAIVNIEEPLLHNQRIAKVSNNGRVAINGFLFYTFLSDRYLKYLKDRATGSTVRHTSLSIISSFKMALPPKEEQNAIADTLSDIDTLITSLEKLIEKKKLIKQGVMQELLTGKKRLPGFTGKWETKTYGDAFQFLNTANYSRDALIDNGDFRYIHYGDIHTKFDGYLDLANSDIPCIRQEQVKSYALVKSGDVIMADASEDYSGIGKSVEVINDCDVKAIAGLHTFLLRDTEQLFVNGYRSYIYAIESIKKQFDFLATGMKVFGVSKSNLKKVVIPVPPKEEQKAIVNVIGSIANEISSYEIQLSKYRLLKQATMQELLTGRIRL
ncbi:MAG: restriction endonuclease subunit S, partial [Candidatus Cloacimonas sp.]|nr:restriction endonuclease subunit S [Candidatus Cloacimonas sp.]